MSLPQLNPKPQTWPRPGGPLSPEYLVNLNERLILQKSRLRHFIETANLQVGFDLDFLLTQISYRAFTIIRVIAMQAPPTVPPDQELIEATNALASELQTLTGDAKKPELIPDIVDLPDQGWDDCLKGFCTVFEASVDTYLIGDLPGYQARFSGNSPPDKIYRIYSRLVDGLGEYSCLWGYQNRLKKKLESSRSGVLHTDLWMKETKNAGAAPKRKLDTLGLDEPAKKRLLNEMKDWPRLDRLLSTPVEE